MNFHNWAYANWYNDMLSIDRIDVNGDYEPDNCRWVDKNIQANNKSCTIYIDYKGNVGACSYIPKFADNIKDKALDDILLNNKLFVDLREYKNKLEGKCKECNYKMICGGCRASALALKKSIFAEDPLCLAN